MYTFKSRGLCWFYRIVAPIGIVLVGWTLVSGYAHWYFIPTDVIAIILWGYLSFCAWIKRCP